MRCLIKNIKRKWIFLLVLVALSSCYKCNLFEPKPRNPNLQFLVGDTLGDTLSDPIHCTNPVVSPDGETVYFLQANGRGPGGNMTYVFGSVYTIDVDGSNYNLILDGVYNSLAISHDGEKLAVQPNIDRGVEHPEPESLILILDLNTSKIDSYPTVSKYMGDIEFPKDTGWIYYSSWPKLYKLNLSDSISEEIPTSDEVYEFDLFNNDSFYIDPDIVLPQINPLKEEYVIGNKGEGEFFGLDLVMRNIPQSSLIYFPEESFNPYYGKSLGLVRVWVGFPYWFPDGNTIVFSVSRSADPGGNRAEIWILKNVFKQIE